MLLFKTLVPQHRIVFAKPFFPPPCTYACASLLKEARRRGSTECALCPGLHISLMACGDHPKSMLQVVSARTPKMHDERTKAPISSVRAKIKLHVSCR